MLALVNGGTFDSATGGTFHSDIPGTFESDMGGTFKVMQSLFRLELLADLAPEYAEFFI